MANREHLDMLKQGVAAWNRWRRSNPKIHPDLARVNLDAANLIVVDLSGANPFGINLNGADLSRSDLRQAELNGADLSSADLSGADLSRSALIGANLSGADLSGADLSGTDLRGANLGGTNLRRVDLRGADLRSSNLSGAQFDQAHLARTIFGEVDLSRVQSLETVRHGGPSTIGIDTIYRSQGHIPEDFLRKAGVPDSFITYLRSLVIKPIDYYTCFISYASKDQVFAERLYIDLQSKGIRCWFAPEDMKIGDNIHTRIDESIRLYDKLLLVLSEHSLKSSWVEREVVAAFEKEQQQDQRVLFPIRLDESVIQTSLAWAADIRRRKHIGDFTRWKQHDVYQQAFERLLRDLKAEA